MISYRWRWIRESLKQMPEESPMLSHDAPAPRAADDPHAIDAADPTAVTPRWWRRRGLGPLPGLVLVAAIAGVATWLGSLAPVVGGPVFGIVLGVLVAAIVRRPTAIDAGAAFAGKYVLQVSVVVLGTGLSLRQVAVVGLSSLPVMLGTLAVALLGAWLVGKALRVEGGIRTLIGVGTGICGASAIAATTSVIGAGEAEVAYAMGTIFTFNIAAVLLFPTIGHLLGLSQHAFGLWAGTAINDTSSVVAASTVYGHAAAQFGVVVKLTRTLMIIPISLVLSVMTARKTARAAAETAPTADSSPAAGTASAAAAKPTHVRIPWGKVVPVFLIGFLAASALDTLGVIPASWHPTLSATATFMITMALTGIGLGTRWATIRSAGHRPLLLGAILWALVALTSLGLQALTGTL
jgi:uncharacterized integral membrane protein (TIGR00698 family)